MTENMQNLALAFYLLGGIWDHTEKLSFFRPSRTKTIAH
jgi:hypothetical protein